MLIAGFSLPVYSAVEVVEFLLFCVRGIGEIHTRCYGLPLPQICIGIMAKPRRKKGLGRR